MDEIMVDVYCHVCKGLTSFVVPKEGFQAWRAGALIQKALPGLSAENRELMISGTCPTCFDKMFGSDDEWT